MSEATTKSDAETLATRLQAAAERYEAAKERVEAEGEARLERLQEHYRKVTTLMERYESRATSDGEEDVDMEAFIEYQEELAHFVEHLPEDLPHRDGFEQVDEIMHQKWLKSDDFQDARDALAPVASLVERLDERQSARQEYHDARTTAEKRVRELDDHIEDLQRLVELGEAELDAPVEHLKEPIERYNDRVTDAFDRFKHDAPAREVLVFVAATDAFPLVEYRQPPADLREYIERADVGTEPIRELLAYADYSKSKLEHYVENAAELKRNVATHQTYLQRLDGGPLTVSWPPPEASELRFRCKELIPAVDRLVASDALDTADDEAAEAEALDTLRTVRALADREDYDRLRDSAVARERLDDEERQRLQRGEVQDELADCRDQRERLAEALSEYDR